MKNLRLFEGERVVWSSPPGRSIHLPQPNSPRFVVGMAIVGFYAVGAPLITIGILAGTSWMVAAALLMVGSWLAFRRYRARPAYFLTTRRLLYRGLGSSPREVDLANLARCERVQVHVMKYGRVVEKIDTNAVVLHHRSGGASRFGPVKDFEGLWDLLQNAVVAKHIELTALASLDGAPPPAEMRTDLFFARETHVDRDTYGPLFIGRSTFLWFTNALPKPLERLLLTVLASPESAEQIEPKLAGLVRHPQAGLSIVFDVAGAALALEGTRLIARRPGRDEVIELGAADSARLSTFLSNHEVGVRGVGSAGYRSSPTYVSALSAIPSNKTDEARPLTCFVHPMSPAKERCRTCTRPLCDLCAVGEDRDGRPRCAACAQRQRRRFSAALGTAVAVAVAAFVGVGVRAKDNAPRPEKSSDESASATKIHRMEDELKREPCNRELILDLAETVLKAGDERGSLRRAEAFFQGCGDYPRLRWVTYAAHKQLREWDKARDEATKLIESNPYDADFRVWRAKVFEHQGDLVRAATDFRQAILLRPKLQDVPLDLARVYEAQGKPCEAIQPLAHLVSAYPEARNATSIRLQLEGLRSKPECSWAIGEGRAEIDERGPNGAFRAAARVNERERGAFAIDKGAPLVMLSRAFAKNVGIDAAAAPEVIMSTGNGKISVREVILDKVEVQGLVALRVPAVIVDGLEGLDGRLGMSFLSRFDVTHTAGKLELTAIRGR